ncbi:MAG: UDP-3-O-(3-hydroxymyristoyl)glucosamine N-acyltransferase [Deferribacteraceae bacterium]|jgi:UDP-3-O-[3-hydroxymyristoyl] glucosamine N-acyltransferase|nr:UDP-3-O-(3-hydroxymyristoyl)glucosamine N-acyltransferase [Deferribacteraceae bacterium]
MKLSEIAAKINGTLVGADCSVKDLSTPEAQTPNSICILSSAKLAEAVKGAACCYAVPRDFPVVQDKSFILLNGGTRTALADLLEIIRPMDTPPFAVSPKASLAADIKLGERLSVGDYAVLESGCSIGSETVIYPGVYIGRRVKIGKKCIIYPNVTIYEDTEIGDGVIIHAGTVLGADGFGFVPGKSHRKIPQRGNVIIHDDAELGANSTVDRATIGSTVIGQGTKIDNMVHVGHNVKIGAHCLIAAQCGISGSTEIGDYVIFGGQVGVADHAKIASFTSFAAKTGVHKNILEKGAYGGAPAIEAKLWMRQVTAAPTVPELRRRVANIERRLGIDNAGKKSSDN